MAIHVETRKYKESRSSILDRLCHVMDEEDGVWESWRMCQGSDLTRQQIHTCVSHWPSIVRGSCKVIYV